MKKYILSKLSSIYGVPLLIIFALLVAVYGKKVIRSVDDDVEIAFSLGMTKEEALKTIKHSNVQHVQPKLEKQYVVNKSSEADKLIGHDKIVIEKSGDISFAVYLLFSNEKINKVVYNEALYPEIGDIFRIGDSWKKAINEIKGLLNEDPAIYAFGAISGRGNPPSTYVDITHNNTEEEKWLMTYDAWAFHWWNKNKLKNYYLVFDNNKLVTVNSDIIKVKNVE